MNEWKEIKTPREWVEALARGDEIEYGNYGTWAEPKYAWFDVNYEWRSRPKKKVKTIVLREALYGVDGKYATSCVTEKGVFGGFIKWLDTPGRVIEIEE